MTARSSTAPACPRCGAGLRQEDARPAPAGARELVVPCVACGTECRVPLGGVVPEPVAASATVERAEPPFRDLPAEPAPPFAPLAEPSDASARKRTLAERWNAIPTRWQKGGVATVVAAIIAGGAFWPKRSEAFPPRTPQPEPATVVQLSSGAPIQFPPPREVPKFLVARLPIPLNTAITRENVGTYFREIGAENPPAGALTLTSAGVVYGKFAQRDIAPNVFATADLFGEAAIAPPPRAYKPERTTVRVHSASGTIDYVYEQTATGYRQVSPGPGLLAPGVTP